MYICIMKIKNINYSIYNWYDHLRQYIQNDNLPIDDLLLKNNCDHFIGSGVFDYIYNKITDIYDKFSRIKNIDEIKNEFSNLSDVISKDHIIRTYFAFSYNNYYHDDNYKHLSGTMPAYSTNLRYKLLSILINIVSPTLFYNGKKIRNTYEQEYVIIDKYKCINFNINDYYIFQNENYIFDLYKYSTIKIINNVYPTLDLKVECEDYYNKKFNLFNFEKKLDQILNVVLKDINYKHIIFDYSRINRNFDIGEVNEYNLKIIL